MPIRRPHSSGLPAALRALELGYNSTPTIAPYLGGFRTTPEDEFGFWNIAPTGHPIAVPPFTVRFSTNALNGHALLAADEEGVVTILDTRRSLLEQLHAYTPSTSPFARFRAHDNAIFDAVWLNNDADVATAGGDGTVRVFDSITYLRKALCRGAPGSVKAVRVLPTNPSVLVSAARDGNVRFFDMRVPSVYVPSISREMFHRPVCIVEQPHASAPPRAEPSRKRRRIRAEPPAARVGSVTSLAFLPGRDDLLYTAGSDGTVKTWDLRAYQKGKAGSIYRGDCVAAATPGLEDRPHRSGSRRRHGVAAIDIDPNGGSLIVSATDSTIYLYDAHHLHLGHSKVLSGHTQTSFYIRAKFSPCGRFVASGSADSKAYLWDVTSDTDHGRLDPILELDGHRGGEAAVVDWCAADPFKLASCADDSTAKVWRVDLGKQFGPARTGAKDEEIFNGARRVAQRKKEKVVTKSTPKRSGSSKCARRLKDSDIRSFFKGAGAPGSEV